MTQIQIDLIVLFFTFMVVKASNNALIHDYAKWKQRLGISIKWDFYFNPAISYLNKYRKDKILGFISWQLATPFSDIWHTLWTVWQFYFVYVLMTQLGVWYGLGVGVAGVFVIFNGLYNFLRYKKYV